MTELAELVLWSGLPMAAAWFLYLLADRIFSVTKRLTKRTTFFSERKAAFQLAIPFAFILLFGAVCLLCGLPKQLYYAVCGAFVGLDYGLAAEIMRNEQ